MERENETRRCLKNERQKEEEETKTKTRLKQRIYEDSSKSVPRDCCGVWVITERHVTTRSIRNNDFLRITSTKRERESTKEHREVFFVIQSCNFESLQFSVLSQFSSANLHAVSRDVLLDFYQWKPSATGYYVGIFFDGLSLWDATETTDDCLTATCRTVAVLL